MKILITSGGTRIPIDDVRYIGNMSTGRYGALLAEEAIKRKWKVHLLAAKHSVLPLVPDNTNPYNVDHFVSFEDYRELVLDAIKETTPNVIISAAAVSDWTVAPVKGKISGVEDTLSLTLKRTPKVISEMRQVAAPNTLLIGFKLLVSPTYSEVYNAVRKVLNNGADYVVYNDLTRIKAGDATRLIFDQKMNFRSAENTTDLMNIIASYADDKAIKGNA